jgi:hypothetical protein
MDLTMEQLNNSKYAYEAWDRAIKQGYVYKSIQKYVGQELYNLLIGGVAGIVLSVGLVMVGSGVGAAIGAGLGGFFNAGNPAAAIATAELGATIGKTVAQMTLAALGVYMIVEYVAEHAWEIGQFAIAAFDLAVNQAPYLAGQAYETLMDLAARYFAEAVGLFCGFLVFAVATLIMVKMATSKSKSAIEVRELFESKLNQMCKGIVQYILPKAQELRFKLQPKGMAKFAVVKGGVGPGKMSVITTAARYARRVMPRVVDPITRMVRFRSFSELDAYLRSEGFKLTGVKEFGPDGSGGKQIFYERGNVCCRVKTHGDKGGPREATPHISFGLNDGTGTEWNNDLSKFSFDGKLAFKNNGQPARFKPVPGGTNPKDFQGIQGGLDASPGDTMQDAWAQRTHFNTKPGFNWSGVDQAISGAPVSK